uniref:Uncharacterized protein n=1 Tax=Aegilops tauschii subsp. strangulata TaxID=200361 RepID=A0A453IAZ4_AEGTS
MHESVLYFPRWPHMFLSPCVSYIKLKGIFSARLAPTNPHQSAVHTTHMAWSLAGHTGRNRAQTKKQGSCLQIKCPGLVSSQTCSLSTFLKLRWRWMHMLCQIWNFFFCAP